MAFCELCEKFWEKIITYNPSRLLCYGDKGVHILVAQTQ